MSGQVKNISIQPVNQTSSALSRVILSLSKHSVSTAIYFSEAINQYPKYLLLEKKIVSEKQESPGFCQL